MTVTLHGRPGGTSAEAVAALYDRLLAPETGPSGPVLLPAATAGAADEAQARITQPLDGVDVVIGTSGSTDGPRPPRRPVAGRARRRPPGPRSTASGGPGQWVTSLPVHGVAGFQVVPRSVLAGVRPGGLRPPGRLRRRPVRGGGRRPRPRADGATCRWCRPSCAAPSPLAPDVLAAFDAILVGGAALPPDLAARAAAAGARIVSTYGSTETSGGCVYDGVPLDGVERPAGRRAGPRGGPPPGHPLPRHRPPSPSSTTTDAAGWPPTTSASWSTGASSVLRGRADDVIISGGVNVNPARRRGTPWRRSAGSGWSSASRTPSGASGSWPSPRVTPTPRPRARHRAPGRGRPPQGRRPRRCAAPAPHRQGRPARRSPSTLARGIPTTADRR